MVTMKRTIRLATLTAMLVMALTSAFLEAVQTLGKAAVYRSGDYAAAHLGFRNFVE